MACTVYFWDGSKSNSYQADSDNSLEAIGGLQSDSWEFLGWSMSTSDTGVAYAEGEVIDCSSSTRIDLYAVYRKLTTIYCWYLSGGAEDNLKSNVRDRIQYRCNTSKTASSTNFYNTITLPNFSTSNQWLDTSYPQRSWMVDGWRLGTTAGSATYSGGQSVSTDRITGDLYAVYSSTCTISYNSNGGSGSTSSSSTTVYYSASGNYTTPSFTVKSCSFTAPTGKQFGSWNTRANGNGTSYSSGSTIYTSDDVVLYAIWYTADFEYTVYFYDGNLSKTVNGLSSSNPVIAMGPLRSDWEFIGWSTTTSNTSVAYSDGEVVDKPTSSTSVNLYAVYRQRSYVYFHFLLPDGTDSSQSREKIQYRCNTSTTASSTNFYNSITIPSFSTANSTIEIDGIEWNVRGWRDDTTAADKEYTTGASVSTGSLPMNVYAVYSYTGTLSYNSNGGSGSMSQSSSTAYRNACGNHTTPSYTIKSCTFTAPTGKNFSHWNLHADGSSTSYTSGTISKFGNIMLYAIWVAGTPAKWSWTTNVAKGAAVVYTGSGSSMVIKPLTATEWLAFADRVKEFYTYKGVTIDSTYWYRAINGVTTGSPMTSTQANGMRYLINVLNPPTAVPNKVEAGDKITAAFINGLKDSLNSLI